MLATGRFEIRITEQDKRKLAFLEKHCNRKKAKIVKALIDRAYEVLKAQAKPHSPVPAS